MIVLAVVAAMSGATSCKPATDPGTKGPGDDVIDLVVDAHRADGQFYGQVFSMQVEGFGWDGMPAEHEDPATGVRIPGPDVFRNQVTPQRYHYRIDETVNYMTYTISAVVPAGATLTCDVWRDGVVVDHDEWDNAGAVGSSAVTVICEQHRA